jgi:metallo-beta-lactamase class B VIM
MRKLAVVLVYGVLGLVSNPAYSETQIELRPLAEGVWIHTSYYTYPGGIEYPSNGLVVRDGRGLILIDTAWGEIQTGQLLKIIKAKINLPITVAMVTHSHGDRASGIDVLKANNIKAFAHPLTKQLTVEHGLPVPDEIFSQLNKRGSTVGFGNTEVFFPGTAHATDNLMVWVPDHKILFGGCAVRAMSTNSAGNTAHVDAASWLQAIRETGQRYKSDKIIVPGHGESGGVELLAHTEKVVGEAVE